MSKSTRTPEPTDDQGEIVEEQLGGGSASPGTKATTRRKLLQIGAGLAAVTLRNPLILRTARFGRFSPLMWSDRGA